MIQKGDIIMNDVATLISTLGFPIVACVGLAWFCKYMIDQNNQHIEKMFILYDTANKDNREAIEACTKAVEKLCDKIDKEDN
jgi:hypothetical protein